MMDVLLVVVSDIVKMKDFFFENLELRRRVNRKKLVLLVDTTRKSYKHQFLIQLCKTLTSRMIMRYYISDLRKSIFVFHTHTLAIAETQKIY